MLRLSPIFCVIFQLKIISTLDPADMVLNIYDMCLDDVLIAVKTDRRHQDTKFPIIFNTWFQVARDQTWFFTDVDNPMHQKITNGHMIMTQCSPYDICCKTGAEINHFLWMEKKWLCHFEDDNYVNVIQLEKELQRYNYSEEWYIGRSYEFQIAMIQLSRPHLTSFQYAYGKAGWCISRALAKLLESNIRGYNFNHACNLYRLADDSTLGYILATRVQVPLTYVGTFHSHFEPLNQISEEELPEQISLSYSKFNYITITGFPEKKDPTRFMSLHCLIYPDFDLCDDPEYKGKNPSPQRSILQRVFRFFTKTLSKVFEYGK